MHKTITENKDLLRHAVSFEMVYCKGKVYAVKCL